MIRFRNMDWIMRKEYPESTNETMNFDGLQRVHTRLSEFQEESLRVVDDISLLEKQTTMN